MPSTNTPDVRALHDTLRITRGVVSQLKDVSEGEVHLFAYLSCLLFLYSHRSVSEWGYHFAATTEGSPFSTAINLAVNASQTQGYLMPSTEVNFGYFRISPIGERRLKQFDRFRTYGLRAKCIDGATESLLALPIGSVRSALLRQREISSSRRLEVSRELLQDSGVRQLHREFAALSQEIGPHIDDLMIPSVVWLSYLNHTAATHRGEVA